MNQAQIAKIVAAVVVALQDGQSKKPSHKAVSTYKAANKYTPKGRVDGLSSRQLDNDVKVAKAFKKLGMNVTPRVDVMTYKAWLAKGLRVNKGQHGVFVKGVGTMFHSGQVSKDTTFDYLDQPKAPVVTEVAGSFPA